MREGCNIKQLLSDLRGIMIYRGMNCRTLGEKVHKDAATVARQLDPERSNPTAAVLIEYAEAMDATIVAMTREAAQAMADADISAYRGRLAEMGAEVERLKAEIARLNGSVARRDEIMADQREQIARLNRIVDYKEEDIHRKDLVIKELYDKIIELQKGGQT